MLTRTRFVLSALTGTAPADLGIRTLPDITFAVIHTKVLISDTPLGITLSAVLSQSRCLNALKNALARLFKKE